MYHRLSTITIHMEECQRLIVVTTFFVLAPHWFCFYLECQRFERSTSRTASERKLTLLVTNRTAVATCLSFCVLSRQRRSERKSKDSNVSETPQTGTRRGAGVIAARPPLTFVSPSRSSLGLPLSAYSLVDLLSVRCCPVVLFSSATLAWTPQPITDIVVKEHQRTTRVNVAASTVAAPKLSPRQRHHHFARSYLHRQRIGTHHPVHSLVTAHLHIILHTISIYEQRHS